MLIGILIGVFLIPTLIVGASIFLFALILTPHLIPFALIVVGVLLIIAGLAILI